MVIEQKTSDKKDSSLIHGKISPIQESLFSSSDVQPTSISYSSQKSENVKSIPKNSSALGFYAEPINEKSEVFFFQTCAVPEELLKNACEDDEKYENIKEYSRFRVDICSNKHVLSENERKIYSLALRILNRGKITWNSKYVEDKLKSLFEIESFSRYNIDSIDNYINYQKVKNSTDSRLEESFINTILKSLLGSNWASHVMTQVYLDTITEQERKNNSQRRIDFLIKQKDLNIVVELDGPEHGEHQDADLNRDRKLRESGYRVVRIKNRELEEAKQLYYKLREETGLLETKKIGRYSSYNKLLIASKLIHQIQIAITKSLEQGYICKGDIIDYDVQTDAFNSEQIKILFEIAIKDLEDLIFNLSLFYDMDLSLNLDVKKQGRTGFNQNDSKSIVLGIGNYVDAPRYVLIRDIAFKDEILCKIESFESVNPLKFNKEALSFFLDYIFRFESFREGQEEAIARLLAKKDTIVLLPTGSGKSLVYELASFIVPGQIIVVSPITSLMQDQVYNLKSIGIDNAIALYWENNRNDLRDRLKRILFNNYSLIYISPERMQIAEFRNLAKQNVIYSVAVDEAHCVSEWGHDFRTAYLNIAKNSREVFKKNDSVPVMIALTGTASKAVLNDIRVELDIMGTDSVIVPKTFDREELNFSIYSVDSKEKFSVLKDLLLNELPDDFKVKQKEFTALQGNNTYSGIIFCPFAKGKLFSVKAVKDDIESMEYWDGTVECYSAKSPMSDYESTSSFSDIQSWNEKKRKNAEAFKKNQINILVATKAFGMGIDKPNIRYTVHYGIPPSIESFYQEAGRAGRDRKRSECIVIFSNENDWLNDEMLGPATSLEELQRYGKREDSYKYYKHDDIKRNLYFHFEAFKGVKAEFDKVKVIKNLLLVENKRFITAKGDDNRQDVEKALQRLLVLGVINDYTVDYSSYEYDIRLGKTDPESIIQKYCGYVERYSKGRITVEKKKLTSVLPMSDLDFIDHAAKTLIEFIYDNIEQGRRRCLLEMLRLAESVSKLKREKQNSEIKKKIREYFDSSYGQEIDSIREASDLGFGKIKEIFNKEKESEFSPSSIKGQVSRYLESTYDHPGLLFLRSLSEYYTWNHNVDEIMSDFHAGIEFAISHYSVNKAKLLDFIIYFLTKVCEREESLKISEADSIYPSLLEIAFEYFDKLQLCKMIIDKCENKEMINLTMLVYMEIQSENLISIINQKRR